MENRGVDTARRLLLKYQLRVLTLDRKSGRFSVSVIASDRAGEPDQQVRCQLMEGKHEVFSRAAFGCDRNGFSQDSKTPFAPVPVGQRLALTNRLVACTTAFRKKDWAKRELGGWSGLGLF
jgi:hypothetical protein